MGFSDEIMGMVVPIAVYWFYSGLYYAFQGLDRFRLHSRADEVAKNSVPVRMVAAGVLLQHQAMVSLVLFAGAANDDKNPSSSPQTSFLGLAKQFFVAMLVMDTWQYFLHRYMHHNKFLYRHLHSQHHRLVVPYAFGAMYNHPIEGFLLDTVGGALSYLISGMSPRTSIVFFSFTTIKNIDDHCGLWLPSNPFHVLFYNNTAYHDIHHQLHGSKYNFAQPFFRVWDKVLGTHMPYSSREDQMGELKLGSEKMRNALLESVKASYTYSKRNTHLGFSSVLVSNGSSLFEDFCFLCLKMNLQVI